MPSPNRRSGRAGTAPTGMMQAVGGLEKWKLTVMFFVGLLGMAALGWWFAFATHEHSTVELIIAAIMFGVFAFFVFPLGITRLADKFWPDKWRKDRRSSQNPGVRQ